MARARISKGKKIVIGVVALLVVVVVALLALSSSFTGPVPPPLGLSQLSPATQSANVTSLDGTWVTGDGSLAGFRVNESFLIQTGTIVGRTSAVSGSLVISQSEISSGSFQVDLRNVAVGGKQNASFFKLLQTSDYPDAAITLTKPIVFDSIRTDGQAISSQAAVSLCMRGVTRAATLTFKAHSNGSVLEATGSAPVQASDWSIESPFGVGNDALIEFLIVLKRV